MHIRVNISTGYSNLNDFYFQWDYIFWWQMKFNVKVCASMLSEKIYKNIGDA